MNKIYRFAFILPIMFAVLVCASATNAQRRYYTKAEVDRLIHNAENRSDAFVGSFDRSLDRSHLNGSDREDWLNGRAKDLERALDDLRHEFDRRERYLDARDEVRRCLNIATDINVAMRNNRFGARTEQAWAVLRSELNTLAGVYNLPNVGSRAY